MSNPRRRLPVVVLISGGGTNLQALIDAAAAGAPFEIRAVISNQPNAYGLERANRAGIPSEVLDHRRFPDRRDFDEALARIIDNYQPELILLAGFMRILTPEFVKRYHGRMLNIHPSLLPRFQGLNTHARVLEAGETEHGASIHYVTEELDGGPVIIQARVPVRQDDTPQTLAARVLAQEHRIYPLVVNWVADGRLTLDDDKILFDGKPLSQPLRLEQVREDR